MSRSSNSVDYSVLYECESKVDSSFRRLRLSHDKLKKTVSGAHEGYLRKILDVKRKLEAQENNQEYNKRRKQRRQLIHPLSEDGENRAEPQPPAQAPAPIEEAYSDSGISDLPSPKPEKEAVQSTSEFASSPYRRAAPAAAKSRPCRLRRGNTTEVLQAEEDLSKEFAEGRMSQAQYHKMLLLRKRMIHVMCLEDLDDTGEGKSVEDVERERQQAEKELQKMIERYPKAYALLHPRTKVAATNSTAFRPHRDPPKRAEVAPQVKRKEPHQEKPTRTHAQSYRQQFFVNTRAGTPGGLGGDAPIRTADLRHGGRLSAQNMVNYLLNKPTPTRKPSMQRMSPPPPGVRGAVQRARDRIVEERSRSVPRLESVRLQSLSRTRCSHTSSTAFLDVGVDIQSHLGSPRGRDSHFQRSKKASLRDLLDY